METNAIFRKNYGSFRRFFSMLGKAKLPYLWIIGYLAANVVIANVGVSTTEYSAALFAGNVGLTAVVARTSAGALNYTPVARVANLTKTIEQLKDEGLWFVCADMDGTRMYDLNMKGPIGLVIGNEGTGVGRLVKEKCDMVAAIPMKGEIDSLNASVAAGVLAYEIVRQRLW